jgi:hypothetical protein
MLSYSAPLRTMLHPYELLCTILSYFAHPLGNAVPYWARLHLPELRCTFLSCAAPSWAVLHLPELCCTLLSCAANCWTTLQCLGYCTLTKLPPFLQFFRCRTVWHSVSLVSEWKEMQMPEPVRSGTEIGRPRPVPERSGTGMTDDGIPMLMPSYGFRVRIKCTHGSYFKQKHILRTVTSSMDHINAFCSNE